MSRMLNALKQIEAMSPHPPHPPHPPLPTLPTLPTEAATAETAPPPTEQPKPDSVEAELPNVSPVEAEPPETQSPESSSNESPSAVAETLEEVRDEMAMEDSLLKVEAAMVTEGLPVDADNPTEADNGALAPSDADEKDAIAADAEAEETEREPEGCRGTALEPKDENRRAYEALGEEILSRLAPGRPAALMFTSPSRSGDTTDILVSLAATLVERIDGEILLVDVDLHEPRLADRLGIETHRGLADVLQGVAAWEELIRPTNLPRVSLLPGVKFPWQGGGLQRLNLGPLLNELSAGYSLVLLDAASLDHAEIAPVSRWCQGTYLAVKLGHTRRGEAMEAERLVRGYGGQVAGCVVVG